MRVLLITLLGVILTPSVALASGGANISPETFILWGPLLALAFLTASAAERLGQAGVVGALVAGVAIAAFDGYISIPDMAILSTIGMAVLLFEAGLESDLDEMRKELKWGMAVAMTGVILPAIAGTLYALWALGITNLAEIGTYAVALTATSVGISLQVLKQMELEKSREAKIIISAAVADDIIGMAGLAALSGVAAAGALSFMGVVTPVGIGMGFIVGFIVIGSAVNKVIPGEKRSLAFAAILTSLALYFAAGLGIAMIIATFVAGAVLAADSKLHKAVEGLGLVLYAPAFFAVGLLMDWSVMSMEIVPHILGLSVLAFASKFVAGFVLPRELNRPLVGSAMASRGEVGLAVVSIAKGSHWIGPESFAILTGTIILVTVAAPFAMKACIGKPSRSILPAE